MADAPKPDVGKLPPWAIVAAGGIGLVLAMFWLGKGGGSSTDHGDASTGPDLTSVAENLIDALANLVQPSDVQDATAGHPNADDAGAVSSSGGSRASGGGGGKSTATPGKSTSTVSTFSSPHAVWVPGIGYVSTPAFEGSNARLGSGVAID